MLSHNFSQKTNIGFLSWKFTTSRLIQKESLSSFCKKKILFCTNLKVGNFQGRNPTFVLWEQLWLDSVVSRLTDLYHSFSLTRFPLTCFETKKFWCLFPKYKDATEFYKKLPPMVLTKGQLISKQNCRAITFPKKQMLDFYF